MIEVPAKDLGTACSNNSTWALVTVDGQLWSFFRSENPDVVSARHAIFDKLSTGRSNTVPYSNGGQDQLIKMIIAADAPELDPMLKAELKTYV